MPALDRGAMQIADLAAIETPGPMRAKVRAAVWAYLWVMERPPEMDYPSPEELRAALNGDKDPTWGG